MVDTFIDHRNEVNMFKLCSETSNRSRVVSLQRFDHFDIISMVVSIGYGKM